MGVDEDISRAHDQDEVFLAPKAEFKEKVRARERGSSRPCVPRHVRMPTGTPSWACGMCVARVHAQVSEKEKELEDLDALLAAERGAAPPAQPGRKRVGVRQQREETDTRRAGRILLRKEQLDVQRCGFAEDHAAALAYV